MSTTIIVTVASIKQLKPNPRNARTHSRRQVDQIIKSIRRFGWISRIVVDENHVILAGHGRYEAASQLNLREVPVTVVSGLSDAEKRALALADNKIAANAGWDRKLLADELGELVNLLPEIELDIDITGFTPGETDGLLGDLVDAEIDPADHLPSSKNLDVSRRGDLWLLGPHRLLCGDARSAADFGRLMRGECAQMVITDPPYNLSIKRITGRGSIKHNEFRHASGELSNSQYKSFLRRCLARSAKCSVSGAVSFIFIDWRHVGELLEVGSSVYRELKNIIVWVKTNAGQGTFYRSQHEFICVYKCGDAPHLNNFELGQHGRSRTNVWTYAGVNTFRVDRLHDLAMHPTTKPVALIADALRDCSRRGDIILDPFMGSGTAIVAAERVGRHTYGLEIDPKYVDVAVRRWQSYTKRDAILEQTGQTFDEVSLLRNVSGERHD